MNPYRPPERHYVKNAYNDLPFPFAQEIQTPQFKMQEYRTLPRFLDYLHSRSTVIGYREKNGIDPVAAFEKELKPIWGDPTTPRLIQWPLAVRAARF
jgi:hypothetical protein